MGDEDVGRAPAIKAFLIADIRGYTAFTQTRGDEASARLATRFAELARAEIERGGGSLIELRGDEALAVFDSARQAIRSAIALQLCFVDATVADPTLPLAVGIGIDAGEAVPVDQGYRGGALNQAARLCSLAGPGEVLASREVAHLARKVEGVTYVERGAIRLKGLTEPVDVVGVRPELGDPAQDAAFLRALGPVAAQAIEGLEARNPYKGLRAFEEADAADFFGREALTEHLVERLPQTRFLAVVGPSGSGKSSVVRAGLVPALRRGALDGSERWRIVEMFPGTHPLEELEAGLLKYAENPPSSLMEQLADRERGLVRALKRILPADDSELVLVIDQLEELFTLVEDETQRSGFLSIIEGAVGDPQSRLRVVATLRADFYDRPLLYSGFAELLRDYVEAVVPLTPNEFERAIAGPAVRAGATLEPGLLPEMLADVASEPGALPLLQYALMELYDRRENNVLTKRAYRAIGGVSGALAQRAEQNYAAMGEDAREAARQLFLRLVTPGEGTEDTRRRIDRAELEAIQVNRRAMTTAVDAFGTSRLLSFDRDPRTGSPTVELAHEALVREWGRFRRWVDAAREDLRLHRRLAAAAAEWRESNSDRSYRLRGAHLAQFASWSDHAPIVLTQLEREYLLASIQERKAEESAEAERQERERKLEHRSVNRLRALVGVFAVAALVATGLTTYALVQRHTAQERARVALAGRLGAQAVSEPRIDRAMLLAREAVNLDRSSQTEGTLLSTLLRSPAAVGTFTMPIEIRPRFLAVSGDGRTLVVSDNHQELRFFDTRTRRERRPPLTGTGELAPVRYSPDGSLLMVVGTAKRSAQTVEVLGVLAAQTLKPVRTLFHGPDYPIAPMGLQTFGLSPDNSVAFHVYSAGCGCGDGSDESAFLDRWDVATGKRTTIALGSKGKLAAAITGGGRRLITVTGSEITTWDARTLEKIRSVRQPVASALGAAISPDGRTVGVGSVFGSVDFVDVQTGRLTRGVGGHGTAGPLSRGGYLWSPNGSVFVSTGLDAKVIVWDPSTGRQVETLQGHSGPVFGAAFTAEGQTLYTAGQDGAIFEWDLGTGRRFGRPFRAVPADAPPPPYISAVAPPLAFSPDGSSFASRTTGPVVGLFSLETLKAEKTFSAVGADFVVSVVAWSPPHDRVVVGSNQGEVRVWRADAEPRLERTLEGLPPAVPVESVAVSPDGNLIAAGGATIANVPVGDLAVWGPDAKTPKWKVHLDTFGDVLSLAFSPDGATLAAAIGDGRVLMLDSATGRVERTLRPSGTFLVGTYPTSASSVAFNPDGSLLTATLSGLVQRWTAAGQPSGDPVLVSSSGVTSLSVARDGSQFATAGGDGSVKLWSTATLQQFGSDLPKGPGPGNARYAPDGETLVVVYEDGSGFVWPVSPDAWKRHACDVAGRNFTREEWRRYVTGLDFSTVCP
jgi:WD40 repeat protein/class 3 adenylate cyclase